MDYNERLMLSEPHDILSDFVLCIENGSQFIAYTSAMKLAQWYEQNRDALSALSAKNECKEDETMLADLRRYCKVVKDLDMNEFARLHQEQGETPLYDRGMTYSDMMHFKMVCERIVEKVEPQPEGLKLPKDIDTELARKVFGKAIEKGWMELLPQGGCKWLDIDGKGGYGSKSRLAYMLREIYTDPGGGKQFPENALDTFFGEKRLGESMRKLDDRREGKPKGYEKIDSLFQD